MDGESQRPARRRWHRFQCSVRYTGSRFSSSIQRGVRAPPFGAASPRLVNDKRDKRCTPCSQPLPTHETRLQLVCLICSVMSHDFGPVVEKARMAVRAAHNDFRSLYKAVSDPRSMPMALHVTGNTLDHLAQNLDNLARSTNALSSDVTQKAFDTRMSNNIKLSDAILQDMTAVASRLRLMTLSASSELVTTMEEDQCRDIENMAIRYDQAISSILDHHSSCVHWLDAATMIGSPCCRSSLDVLVDGTRALLEGMADIRGRFQEQNDSAHDELRISTK
jgi:hypothetical protein